MANSTRSLSPISGNKIPSVSVKRVVYTELMTVDTPMTNLLLFLLLLPLSQEPAVSSPTAISQNPTTITDDQLERYVSAVSAIEKRRAEILRRAKNTSYWTATVQFANNSNRDICSLPVNQQLGEIKKLCRELLEFSEQEIRRHGLSNREFNQITLAQQQDKQLQTRIQQRLMRLLTP